MFARVTNPLPLAPLAISALLAGVGVTGIVMARRTIARAQTPFQNLVLTATRAPSFATLVGAAIHTSPTSDAETIRTKPYGYTSFFGPADEQVVIALLQKWKTEHGTSTCDLVFKYVANGPSLEKIGAYIGASASAAKHVLDTLWPKGKSWTPELFWEAGHDVKAAEREGIEPWRQWLWWRVYSLANRHVCGMVPVT